MTEMYLITWELVFPPSSSQINLIIVQPIYVSQQNDILPIHLW